MSQLKANLFENLVAVSKEMGKSFAQALAGDRLACTSEEARLFDIVATANLTPDQLEALVRLTESTALSAIGAVLAEVDDRSAMGADIDETVRLVDAAGSELGGDLHSEFCSFYLADER